MITPWWFQIEANDSIYQYFGTGGTGNPVVAMPTGTGKSVVIAMFVQSVLTRWPSQRIIVATHVKELVEQNYLGMLEYWPEAPAGIYSAGLNQRDVVFPIIFGGIQSMVHAATKFGHRDLLIVDEAHLISGKDTSQYAQFITALKTINPHLRIIGFSATPYRMGTGMLTDGPIFTDICYDLCSMDNFNKLIDQGYICTLIPKKTNVELNVDDVAIQQGDYVKHELQTAVDKDAITYAACKEIIAQGQDRQSWLVFASGIKHAEHIASCLQSFGIPTGVCHSKLEGDDSDDAIKAYRSGELRCIVNFGKLTTGFNDPKTDMIAMLRPTISTVLWVQMLGRGTRRSPGKQNCLVLDFAGNTKRLGPINDPVIPKKRGHKDGGTPPIKICEQCGVYNHARATICIGCGAAFEMQTKLTSKADTSELIRRAEVLPQIENCDVTKVIYSRYQAKGSGQPTMKVSYICGLRQYNEYVCFEHNGLAGRKAVLWWREAMPNYPVPTRVDQALSMIANIRAPRAIRVWLNKQYPEVMARIF